MMKLREKFYQFMVGRYGMDQLGRMLNGVTLALIVLNLLIRSNVLWFLSLVGIFVTWYRLLSRNMERRRRENDAYLSLRWKAMNRAGNLKGWAGNQMDRLRQRRDYAFFRCPDCKAMLRVPRGKGRIRVTCRKCGAAFERKT